MLGSGKAETHLLAAPALMFFSKSKIENINNKCKENNKKVEARGWVGGFGLGFGWVVVPELDA